MKSFTLRVLCCTWHSSHQVQRQVGVGYIRRFNHDLLQFNCIKNCSLFLFAADCKLIKLVKTLHDCLLLQADINAVCQWFTSWQLKLNVIKSIFFVINIKLRFNYFAFSSVIPQCDNVTDFGLSYTNALISFRPTSIKLLLHTSRLLLNTNRHYSSVIYTI